MRGGRRASRWVGHLGDCVERLRDEQAIFDYIYAAVFEGISQVWLCLGACVSA